MQNSKQIIKCQICNSKDLKSILFLGYLPPVNQFYKLNNKPKCASQFKLFFNKLRV